MCSLPFVIDSSRDAVFVVSPIVVYSMRRSLPTLPAITGPEFSPMPIVKSAPPRSRSQALTSSERRPGHLLRGRQRAVGVVDLLGRRAERRP